MDLFKDPILSCVCVWTIWIDVKLLPCFCRGAVNLIPSTAQRRRWFEIVISGLIIPTYLQFSNFFVYGNRLSQEPACRFIQPQLIQLLPILHGFTRSPQSDWAASEQSFGFIIHDRRHIVADAYWLNNLRRRHGRWHYLWLIDFLIVILFFLMSIQGMENIQENFHYS